MRRLYVVLGLFALLFVLSATPGYAQDPAFGVKGGINFANISQDPEEDDCCDIATRFAIGGFVEKILRGNLALEVDALYNQGGGKGKEDDSGAINIDEFQIPILLKGNLGMSRARPFFVTGPGLGFVTSAKFVDDDGNEVFDLKENDEVETFNFSWIFGFGVHAGPATIEFRYDLGLTDLAKDDENEAKSRTMSILFGYGFGAR